MNQIGMQVDISSNFWKAPINGKLTLKWLSATQISAFPSLSVSMAAEDSNQQDFLLKISAEQYIKSSGSIFSYFAIAPTNSTNILGMNFMENFAIHFDRGAGRVGFASNEGYCEK